MVTEFKEFRIGPTVSENCKELESYIIICTHNLFSKVPAKTLRKIPHHGDGSVCGRSVINIQRAKFSYRVGLLSVSIITCVTGDKSE
jgi:hypothetical protein